MFDLHNNVQANVALKLQTIASDTTTAGEIIDLQGFESCEFLFATGTVTDGTYTVLIQQGDAANLSDATNVADADLLGTEAGASADATDDDDQIGKLGYTGSKRYVRLSIVSASTSSGAVVGALVVLGNPTHAPKTTQITN